MKKEHTIDTHMLHTPDSAAPDCALPLFSDGVQAGFPSPAQDYIEKQLDLNSHVIRHPAATFFVRAVGDSMTGAGIYDGDLLVVDRAVQAVCGKVVIAILDGELTVKRLDKRGGRLCLVAENDGYPVFYVGQNSAAEIWGVVTYVIHRV